MPRKGGKTRERKAESPLEMKGRTFFGEDHSPSPSFDEMKEAAGFS